MNDYDPQALGAGAEPITTNGTDIDGEGAVDADTAARITYASLQNSVPLMRRLAIRAGPDGLPTSTLRLAAHPPFLRPRSWHVGPLGPGEKVEVADRSVDFDMAFLDALEEAERGQLTFALLDAGGAERTTLTRPLDLLARDQWGGADEMAQILTAFVQPNHSVVARILAAAGAVLESHGLSDAMDGYQTDDPGRAWSLAAAIWSAIAGMGLQYAEPPASFERSGQKVRGPGRIAEEGLATCLDTTLLLCGALEAAGLNAAVIFTDGHAFAGVWLHRRTFAAAEVADVIEVRKAIAAREFMAFETTLLTHKPPAPFERAVREADAALSEAREHEFRLAVDVARCRSSGIRPLARLDAGAAPGEPARSEPQKPAAEPSLAPPPDLDGAPGSEAEDVPATPADRIQRWQRKLLDLSLRNRLLNFADTKQTLRLRCDDVPRLEDMLSEGVAFRMVSLPDENPDGGRDAELFRRETGADLHDRFVGEALNRSELCSPLPGAEMRSRLTTLFRKAKSDLSEGGTNTLFLAVGFLRWKPSPTEKRDYRAPLLLVPVALSRASASSEFRLRHQGDEVRFNLTLLEKLAEQGITAQDLKGELPRDEAGLDVPRILDRVRRLVRDVPGFEVVEEIALSTFSFSKYLMWKDLVDRTEQLRSNRLVGHLIDKPDQPFAAPGAPRMPRPEEVDARIDPADLFTPLPADSSQLAAVVGAQEGHDMVVIGPPGTGKSQTIANLMAHCLAHGKTVLFVAEKAAALDVVHRRLEAYGLADAVLELHSNKADRQSVLRQLGAAWDRRADGGEAEWRRLSQELGLRREALDAYVHALHAPGSHGLSVFDAIGMTGDGEAAVRLQWPAMDVHDETSLAELRELAGELGAAILRAERPGPLSLVRAPEDGWSFAWQAELAEARRALRDAASRFVAALERFGGLLGREKEDDHEVLPPLAAAVAQMEGAGDDPAALGGLDPEAALRAGHDLSGLQADLRERRKALTAPYADRELARVPVRRLEEEWRRARAAFWPFSASRRRAVRRELGGYAEGARVDPGVDLRLIDEVQERLKEIAASPLSAAPTWAGVDTDAADLRGRAARQLALREAAAKAHLDPSAIDTTLQGEAEAVLRAQAETAAAMDRFAAAASHRPELAPRALVDALDELGAAEGRLQDWVRWCSLREKAEGRGLGPLAEALEAGRVPGDPVRAFERAYARWWLPLAIDAAPVLRGFLHWEHDERVAAFRRIDEAHQAAAAGRVRARLAHGLPDRSGVARDSALGQLKHQLGLQRPSRTIRALMTDMGETLTRLTPCVLMSPLSVAQYLPAGQAAFDIVIFDEASQITTWDAIGAVARARQSIVVGDPKQMPPTNFFGRADDDEDNELAHYERDLPSILDEAVAAGVPEHTLRVHYRSRDEALIAFSNERYYSNRLVTFPSPATDGRAVRMHRVDGIYRRGDGRTNPEEARAITARVLERLREWLELPEDERPTLGVITFNVQQQQLILDLLDAARAEDPALEWFFEETREEPLIVKNLENIQGDERDIMLFSITFGRDAAGKLSMHFGAMNSDGGEKRLNVAVTRARQELHVFASIGAEDIDLARTRARGVRDLKAFLDYAARGPVALAAESEGSMGGVESPFEAQVKEALEARGWEVRPQIGVSGYRIDLGVVNPERAGAFLAAVECDGAAYHSSPTARDRDRVREAVLRSLGWRIERVWSTDWFMRQAEALDRLDAALQAHLEAWRASELEGKDHHDAAPRDDAGEAPTEEPSRDESPDIPESAGADGGPSSDAPGSSAVYAPDEPAKGHGPPTQASPPAPLAASLAQVEESTEESGDGSSASDAPSDAPDPERFFEQSYSGRLRSMIEAIIAEAGPVHFDAVAREVARQHGWARVGRRIRERVEGCAHGLHRTMEAGGLFLWPAPPVPILKLREVPDRDPSEICVAEIAGLLRERPAILRADDPVQELSRALGLSRLKSNRRAQLDALLSDAARRLAVAP